MTGLPLKKANARQFAVFLFVGGTFSALYALISTWALAYLTQIHWQASAIGYSATILPAYLAQKHLSFRQASKQAPSLAKYIGLQIAAIFFSSALSELLGRIPSLPTLVLFIMTSGCTAIFTYMGMKFYVFPDRKV